MNTSTIILQSAVTVICAVITTVLLPLVAQWLMSKTNNQKMQSAIAEITQLVATTVDYVEQVWVSEFKKNNTWDEDAKHTVFDLATESIVSNLSKATTIWLEAKGDSVDRMIGQYVEAYIQQKKQEVQSNENIEA